MIPLDGLKFGWRSPAQGEPLWFASCPKCECMVMATHKQEHEKVCPNRNQLNLPSINLQSTIDPTGVIAAGLEAMRSPEMRYAGLDRETEQRHKQYQADAIRQADAEKLRAERQLACTDDLGYASRIAKRMAVEFYYEKNFQPLPDLSGVLSQIDNMIEGLGRRQ